MRPPSSRLAERMPILVERRPWALVHNGLERTSIPGERADFQRGEIALAVLRRDNLLQNGYSFPPMAPGRRRDNDAARFDKALQPGGQIGRVADHRLLLRRAMAHKIADDHKAGRVPTRTPNFSRARVCSEAATSAISSPPWTALVASSSCARGRPK